MMVFASCSSYVLGQMAPSMQDATRIITEAVAGQHGEGPFPAIHALRELRHLADLQLRVDGGATSLPKSRSRHFHAALKSQLDVWFTIDDDVDTTRETLAYLLDAVDSRTEPRICFAPYLMRSGTGVALVEWTSVHVERRLPTGGRTRSARNGGFGLVAMNRPAMLAMATVSPSFRDVDDGELKPAPFLETIVDGRWLGEDYAFFSRVPRGVQLEALRSGETTHAGQRLELDSLP